MEYEGNVAYIRWTTNKPTCARIEFEKLNYTFFEYTNSKTARISELEDGEHKGILFVRDISGLENSTILHLSIKSSSNLISNEILFTSVLFFVCILAVLIAFSIVLKKRKES
ncbi:MAG: hypothetical protein QXT63_00890 [Thermoplasmata archaeon]